jgi:hypothetical protein
LEETTRFLKIQVPNAMKNPSTQMIYAKRVEKERDGIRRRQGS